MSGSVSHGCVHARFSQLSFESAHIALLTPDAYSSRVSAAGRFTLDESRVALLRRRSEPIGTGELARKFDLDIITVTV